MAQGRGGNGQGNQNPYPGNRNTSATRVEQAVTDAIGFLMNGEHEALACAFDSAWADDDMPLAASVAIAGLGTDLLASMKVDTALPWFGKVLSELDKEFGNIESDPWRSFSNEDEKKAWARLAFLALAALGPQWKAPNRKPVLKW